MSDHLSRLAATVAKVKQQQKQKQQEQASFSQSSSIKSKSSNPSSIKSEPKSPKLPSSITNNHEPSHSNLLKAEQVDFSSLTVEPSTDAQEVYLNNKRRKRKLIQREEAAKEAIREEARQIRSKQQNINPKTESSTTKTTTPITSTSSSSYRRSDPLTAEEMKLVRNKKLKAQMAQNEKQTQFLSSTAARNEILLPSSTGSIDLVNVDKHDHNTLFFHDQSEKSVSNRSTNKSPSANTPSIVQNSNMLKTWRLTQENIKDNVDVRTAKKMFDLDLGNQFGPYSCSFNRNGKFLLLTGRKGHVSMLNYSTNQLITEFYVNETVRDAVFLHNEQMYALAQKKYVYIYDQQGIELHCLRQHFDVNRLEFLPYHFLLVTVGKTGYLKYHDTSTGAYVAEHRTREGNCQVIKQNPNNAVIHLGHENGVVSLWTPNMNQAVAKIFTHRQPLSAIDIDLGGNYMVTAGLDSQVKVWDVRTFKEVHAYFSVQPVTNIDISDTGLLALGNKSHCHIWRDAFRIKQKEPYMVQNYPGESINSVKFRPFEDNLVVTSNNKLHSLIIPGAGEANFDSFEANPFQTNKQRREAVVHNLLDKLQPDMISLDSSQFGLMNESSKHLYEGQRKELREIREAKDNEATANRNKMRGGNKSSKRWHRSRVNIVEKKHEERKIEIEKQTKNAEFRKAEEERNAAGLPKQALSRFSKKM